MSARAAQTPGTHASAAASRKALIASSFDAAARGYDAAAAIQREAAARLAGRIAALPLPPEARVLEIGCGTGFLSEALVRAFPGARCVFTDLSPVMVGRCRAKLEGAADAAFAVMDGEAPAVRPGFDLVASSFAFQWFLDLPQAAARLMGLLAPGGRLAFATLGAETFAEWRAAQDEAGLPTGLMALPEADALARRIEDAGAGRGGFHGTVAQERLTRRYADAAAFLRELKALGADVPAADYRPLGPGRLRRLLRRLDEAGGGFTVTYQVLYGSFARESAAGEMRGSGGTPRRAAAGAR